MENKMDEQLIPNEERQEAEEAMETPPQPQQQLQNPPSYTAPVYPTGPAAPPQGMYTPQPQQGFIIQNVPVQQSAGCCSGKASWFKHSVGLSTGVIQIIISLIAITLSAVTVWMSFHYDRIFGPVGAPIGGAIFFFLPAGILGACSKSKSNCVIISYLVMSILAAVHAVPVFLMEVGLSISSVYEDCSVEPFDSYPFERTDGLYEDMPMDVGWGGCHDVRYKCLTAIHAITAILIFIEFVVAIVGAAICCNGLSCCCAKPNPQTNANTMVIYPQSGMQSNQAHIVQGSALPVKA